MDKFKKVLFTFLVLITFSGISVFAQQTDPVEMADTMRSNGKIYVVVAVIVTIFFGLIAYLIGLDRKITKLEQEKEF
jgi:O-antigen/teichoic acid export membrane protein